MDYRKLNGVSNMDAYPMPRIKELLDNLGEAKFISTLDLSLGYWQVPYYLEQRHISNCSTRAFIQAHVASFDEVF